VQRQNVCQGMAPGRSFVGSRVRLEQDAGPNRIPRTSGRDYESVMQTTASLKRPAASKTSLALRRRDVAV
jgi:hypothetical protein